MENKIIKAEIRNKLGKQYSKKIRKEGKVPGIFYMKKSEPIPFECNVRELKDIGRYGTRIITVTLNDKTVDGLLREIQYDPVNDDILHIDVMGIDLKEKVTISVPVVLVGTAIGIKTFGGILEHLTREIEIECLPTDIPERIEFDVSNMNIGDSIHIGDLKIEKVRIISKPDLVLATVVPPTVVKEEVEVAPAEEEVKEPELIQKERQKEEIDEEGKKEK
jgi:large subunit ribosomal protein L25